MRGMGTFQIANGNVIFPDEIANDCTLLIKNGRIAEILRGAVFPDVPVLDAEGVFVSPGFVDVHCHGGAGFDFMDGTEEAFSSIENFHLLHGTTSMLATTVTACDEELAAFLAAFDRFCSERNDRTIFRGVHLEGPFISTAQAGAQNAAFIKPFAKDVYKKIINEGKGRIKRWTAAPEIAGFADFFVCCAQNRIGVSSGHTDATFGDIEYAVQNLGLRAVTHLYSSMNGVMRKNAYRTAGAVEAALYFDEITAEIIADGIHLPPQLLRFVYKTKGADGLVLITDASAAAGSRGGAARIGSAKNGSNVIVENGVAFMPDRKSFAGSCATTDMLVRTMLQQTGASLCEAVRMMTLNPAKAAGLNKDYGSIETGKMADILFFDQNIEIKKIIIHGIEREDKA